MPGPPYSQPYRYFVWDATQFMQAHRATWTTDDRRHTIGTIWNGDAGVRAHYAPHRRRVLSPGLPALNTIPANPYTLADANHARGHGMMPAPIAVPGPGGQPGNATVQPLGIAPIQQLGIAPVAPPGNVPAQQQSNAPGLPQTGASSSNQPDRRPYEFWPPTPWATVPTLPPVNRSDMRDGDANHINAFLNTKPLRAGADESNWHGEKLLGVGGFGAAGIWVELDARNCIKDRVVVKETESSAQRWRDPSNWRDRLPKEIRIHQLIEERRAADADMCRHIIRCRGHRLFMAQRRHRLYLDFSNADTLWRAMEDHATNWGRGNIDDINEDAFLPETYIWYVLKALATSCLVLQKGTTDSEAVENWKPITHLDLHLSNVLLHVREDGNGNGAGPGAQDANSMIPAIIPILADFGMSFFSPDSNATTLLDNPEDYLINRVAPTCPPELQIQYGPTFTPLGEPTDVWGIGSIAWELIVNVRAKHGPMRDAKSTDAVAVKLYGGRIPLSYDHPLNKVTNNQDTTLTGQGKFLAAREYTTELRDLVRACLNYDPAERPTLEAIVAQATGWLAKWKLAPDVLRDLEGLGLRVRDQLAFELGWGPFDRGTYRP